MPTRENPANAAQPAATTVELGTVRRVDPQSVFAGANTPLTGWLERNLDMVGATLGMELRPVGSGAGAEIVARDLSRDRIVIIYNQVSPSEESHLGRLMTLAGDRSAGAVVWVGPDLRRSHLQALGWFNSHGGENGIKFYAIGLELFRVDDSKPGVVLRLLESPGERRDAGEEERHGSAAGNGNPIMGTSRYEEPTEDRIAPALAAPDIDPGAEARAKAPATTSEIATGANGVANGATEKNGTARDRAESPVRPAADATPAANISPALEAPRGGERQPEPVAAADPAEDARAKANPEAAPASNQQDAYCGFFERLVEGLRQRYGLTEAKPAAAQNWYSLPSGLAGFTYSIWFSNSGRIKAELYIDVGEREVNEEVFGLLRGRAAELEKECGAKLEWEAIQGGRAYSVSTSIPARIDDPPETLDKTLNWAIDRLVALKEAFGRRLPLMLRLASSKSVASQRAFVQQGPVGGSPKTSAANPRR